MFVSSKRLVGKCRGSGSRVHSVALLEVEKTRPPFCDKGSRKEEQGSRLKLTKSSELVCLSLILVYYFWWFK